MAVERHFENSEERNLALESLRENESKYKRRVNITVSDFHGWLGYLY